MTDPADLFSQHAAAMTEILSGIPGGIAGVHAATDSDSVELVEALGRVSLSVQGLLALAAGEVARRSEGRSKESSLARRHGERSARGLVAAKARIGFGDASRAVAVGEMIRPNLSLGGQVLPPDREHVADAVTAGAMPLPVAVLIDETVEKVRHRMVLNQASVFEHDLVREWCTGTYTWSQFVAHCAALVEILDPSGTAPRDEDLRKRAFLRETKLTNGMLRIVAELDPEAAAFYRQALRVKTNPRRPDQPSDDDGPAGDDAPATDDGASATDDDAGTDEDAATRVDSPVVGRPTPMQSKLAAFTRIMRDSLKAEDGPQAGVDTTILVRMDLDALLTGIGTATIDGITHPITAAAARRLAAEADLIPQVLDGRSQLLDQGKSKREFTKAQRYAILSEFTGCAFPGCDIPSSMVEFHHIGRWATRHSHGKATDLQNGLPLCGFHNRLMEQGWEIRMDENHTPWFTPPPAVDLWQRPIQGGNRSRPSRN